MDFFGDFGLQDRFILKAKCAKINKDRHEQLHMKFSALNVNFDGPSLDFLRLRKPAHESIKNDTLIKVIISPLLAGLS